MDTKREHGKRADEGKSAGGQARELNLNTTKNIPLKKRGTEIWMDTKTGHDERGKRVEGNG